MFFSNTAKTTNIVVTHNVFAYATESIFWNHSITWVKSIYMNDNVWFQQPGENRFLVRWQNENINDLRIYREKSGLDRNSVLVEN
jgi:hypothetical protein